MLLVDTSVWIDHLHDTDPALVGALCSDEVATHPFVIEELAAGSIARRRDLLAHLGRLTLLPVLTHAEYLALVEGRQLWDRGLGPVDLHLVGSALLVAGTQLWTGDRRLRDVASDVGLAVRS